MRNIKTIEANPPASGRDLQLMENMLGVDLPEQFKQWLQLHDGCIPSSRNNFIKRDVANGLIHSVYVDEFFGINKILEKREAYRHRIPDSWMPISTNGGGNFCCLKITGLDRESIYLWDHEQESAAFELLEQDVPPADSNLFMIAASFNKFLELLGPSD